MKSCKKCHISIAVIVSSILLLGCSGKDMNWINEAARALNESNSNYDNPFRAPKPTSYQPYYSNTYSTPATTYNSSSSNNKCGDCGPKRECGYVHGTHTCILIVRSYTPSSSGERQGGPVRVDEK